MLSVRLLMLHCMHCLSSSPPYRRGHRMEVDLQTKINDVVEAFKVALHQRAPCWSTIRTPAALFDFEQSLQAVLNRLQTEVVGAVLESIHRDRDFVTACQNQ